MKGLAQIGSYGGVPIRVHWTTVFLPLGVLAYALLRDTSLVGILWLELFVVAVLACVLLHEIGHAAAARWYKVPVHDILLLPIGGAARLERLPRRASQEASVALAGPLVNLLIAGLLAPALWYWPRYEWFPWLNNYDIGSMLVCLAIFNALVFAFNLIPAFPLDGGRVLRATLTRWMPRLRATRATAFVARVIAMLAMGYAVYEGSFFIGFFGVYAFMTAGREIRNAKVQTFLDEQTIGTIAQPLRVFDPTTPIADVRHQLIRNQQRGAVVADECSPIGFVTLGMLPEDAPPDRHVGDLEMLAVVCHDSQETLRMLSHQFAAHPRSVAIEEIDRRPAGYVDLELLDERFQAFAKTC